MQNDAFQKWTGIILVQRSIEASRDQSAEQRDLLRTLLNKTNSNDL